MKKILILLLILTTISHANNKRELSVFELNKKEQQNKNINKNVKEKSQSEINDIDEYGKKDNKREKIVQIAKSKIGSPYLWGAVGVNKFDCSSFTQFVYQKAVRINLPRISYEQSVFREKINKNIKKGDLLFFETLDKGRISHVGIYIGNNKFIHASSAYKKVVISEFEGFYKEKFRWAISVV